jgi:hypothetical protein
VFTDSDLPEEVTGRAGRALPFVRFKKKKRTKKNRDIKGAKTDFSTGNDIMNRAKSVHVFL